ncbi:prestin-like [Glandiceps talaboti]
MATNTEDGVLGTENTSVGDMPDHEHVSESSKSERGGTFVISDNETQERPQTPVQKHQVNPEITRDEDTSRTEQNDIPSSQTHRSYRIERPIYTQRSFQNVYKESPLEYVPYRKRIKKKFSKCRCSGPCCKGCVTSTLPITKWLPNYIIRKQLLGDIVSGFTVCAMNIPQGMAYGLLASLPPVYGLYVSFFCPIMYALTGTSRQLAIGTFAVISMLVGSAIEKAVPLEQGSSALSGNSANITNTTAAPGFDREQELINAAAVLALLVGLTQLALGLLRLGWITMYFSDPFIRGYTTGAAIHVFSSQIDDLLGLNIPTYSGSFKLIYTYQDIFKNIMHSNLVTIALSASCIVVLIIIKEIETRNKKRLRGYPLGAELLVVVSGTLVSYFLKLEEHDVEVVGDIPTGLPAPQLHSTNYIGVLITDAIAIAIVAFAMSVSMAALFAQKKNYKIDSNQELIAYGTTNTVCSFFTCFPSCCSLSRSLVQDSSGGTSQLAGLVNSGLMLIILLFLAPLLEPLPKAVLASVVLVALKGMFKQFLDLPKLWKYDVIDFNVWWVTCLAVFLFNVDIGLIIGVGFALFVVVWRTQEPYSTVLARIPGTDLYKDSQYFPTAKQVPGIKVFRMHASLYFANMSHFKKRMYKLTGVNPRKILQARAKLELLQEKERKKIVESMKKIEDTVEITVDGVAEHGNNSLVRKTSSELHTPIQHVISDDWTQDNIMTEVHQDDEDAGSSKLTYYEKAVSDSESDNEPDSSQQSDIHTIIVDCAPFNFIDATGVNGLIQLFNEYKKVGIKILLAQPRKRVRETLSNAGFYEKVNHKEAGCLFVTIHDAVLHAVSDDDFSDHEVLVENKDGQIRAHIHSIVEDQSRSVSPFQTPQLKRTLLNATGEETAF